MFRFSTRAFYREVPGLELTVLAVFGASCVLVRFLEIMFEMIYSGFVMENNFFMFLFFYIYLNASHYDNVLFSFILFHVVLYLYTVL